MGRAIRLLAARVALFATGCDDPADDGPIGGFILFIESIPGASTDEIAAIEHMVVHADRIEVVHEDADGDGSHVVVRSEPLDLAVANAATEIIVGQFPIGVGTVEQIRIFPSTVDLELHGGDVEELVDNKQLPSWKQSGWKIVPEDDVPFEIIEDELTGIRARFAFDEKVLHNNGVGYKVKPTVPAETFALNPAEDEPGIHFDKLDVIFEPGTPSGFVDGITEAIFSRVIDFPHDGGTVYRIKLGPAFDLGTAADYYRNFVVVEMVMPAIDYAPHDFTPPDAIVNSTNVDMMNAPAAWDRLRTPELDGVGSSTIRVAIIGGGLDYTHPELYLNIAINQGEIPGSFTQCRQPCSCDLCDVDNDGVISFRDLNALLDLDGDGTDERPNHSLSCGAGRAGKAACDLNGNGYIDAGDLLTDLGTWVAVEPDPADDDDDGNGFADDLVGWDFFNRDNDPLSGANNHENAVAAVLAGLPDNGHAGAGVAWEVSLVSLMTNNPLVADSVVPNNKMFRAMEYLTGLDGGPDEVDIGVIAYGFHGVQKDYDTSCMIVNEDVEKNLDKNEFFDEIALAEAELPRRLLRNTNRLWVISAGNNKANITDFEVFEAPGELFFQASEDNTLLVGGAVAGDLLDPKGTAKRMQQSNFGFKPRVEIWAPGKDWQTPFSVGGETLVSGTSFAAPAVAGAAVLVLSEQPSLVGDPAAVKQRFRNNSDDLDIDENCSGFHITGRLLDLDLVVP